MSDRRSLLAELGRQEQQVAMLRAAYAASMARDGATYWIAEAASELRRSKGRQMVHIAAQLSAAESKISRFERHKTLPADLDDTVAAYAADLDARPIEIWRRALELWEEGGSVAALVTAADGGQGTGGAVAGVVSRLEAAAGSPPKKAPGPPATRPAAKQRKTA